MTEWMKDERRIEMLLLNGNDNRCCGNVNG